MSWSDFDYMSVVDPLSVRPHAVRTVMPFANGQPWNWHQAAAIFDYVESNVGYVPDPRGHDYVAPPLETLECGGGDCDCHAVLVASLCEAVGMTTRLVRCRSEIDGHELCQIDFGQADTWVMTEDLSTYHANQGIDTSAEYWFDEDEHGSKWVFADTSACRYLGDARALFELGYLEMHSDQARWRWRWPVDLYYRRF
jgi:transglutaminase-like putative cysteine protease